MRFFYKTIIILCICICIFFSFQNQIIGAPNEKPLQQQVIDSSSEKRISDRLSHGTYVKGTVFDRSIPLNKIFSLFFQEINLSSLPISLIKELSSKELTFSFSSYKVNLGYFFNFMKNHMLIADIAYYRTDGVEEKVEGITTKHKDYFKRKETTISFQYKGIYELSDELEVLFGTYLSIWKFKSNKKDDVSVVLYRSVLNPTNDQASPVQLSPYFGIVLRPWSSGVAIIKAGWNHHLFQNESVALETEEGQELAKIKRPVEIKGGHSGVLKLKYKHDFGSLKTAVSVQYNRVMVSRFARYEPLNKMLFPESSFEDVKWSNLTFSGKISYNINEDISIKVWGAHDSGGLEYEFKVKTFDIREKSKGNHSSLYGGVGLAYNF